MDARIKSGHDERICFAHYFISQTRVHDLAARSARVVHLSLAPWRAWGMPGAHCTRGLVCTCSGKKHTSNNEYTGTPDIPARNGFNSLCRALPGDRALLPPSPRGYLACPHPVGPTCLPQDLTPASGRQDHTILPSAATSLVSVLFDRSRIQRTRPAIPSPARRCHVHRIPCPTSVTIAIRPSVWDGMREVVDVIWGTRKQKYFCKGDSTANSLICPSGKSAALGAAR
jgi:hypothetical protein